MLFWMKGPATLHKTTTQYSTKHERVPLRIKKTAATKSYWIILSALGKGFSDLSCGNEYCD